MPQKKKLGQIEHVTCGIFALHHKKHSLLQFRDNCPVPFTANKPKPKNSDLGHAIPTKLLKNVSSDYECEQGSDLFDLVDPRLTCLESTLDMNNFAIFADNHRHRKRICFKLLGQFKTGV